MHTRRGRRQVSPRAQLGQHRALHAALGAAFEMGFDFAGKRQPEFALSHFVRSIRTLLLALNFPNELFFYAVVAVAVGPTFGTVAIQNVMFYEAASPSTR